MNEQKFKLFALVELFGHTRLAGSVEEHTIGSASFIRIDIPETKERPAWTKIVNPSAVYAINPITEEVMHEFAENINEAPIEAWDIRRMHEKLLALTEKDEE